MDRYGVDYGRVHTMYISEEQYSTVKISFHNLNSVGPKLRSDSQDVVPLENSFEVVEEAQNGEEESQTVFF